jgi:predicted nuclease of predicted toxin-antitoxin system
MRFFLDENFPISTLALLTELGHEGSRALDVFPSGTGDAVLFEHAQRQNAVFLTTDKDFFHTVPYLYPHRMASVVVIALDQPNRERILNRLKVLLAGVDLAAESNAVYLITDSQIMKRS